MTEAAFHVRHEPEDDQVPRRGEGHGGEDVANLMQMQGSSSGARATRPRRPREWQQALRRLQGLTEPVRTRAYQRLQEWLHQRVNRYGFPVVVQAMMHRDCVQAARMDRLTVEEENLANEEAREVMRVVDNYVDQYHRYQDGAYQAVIVNAANDLAAHFNETDDGRAGLGIAENDRRDFEEVQLQYQVNRMLIAQLRERPELRSRRLRLLQQALRNQLGSESRHLRRMAMALQGLLFLGVEDEDTPEGDVDEQWVADMVDNLVLLTAQEQGEASRENRWYVEWRRLRRWMADDRLLDDVDNQQSSQEDEDPEAAGSQEGNGGGMEKEDKEDDVVMATTQQDPDISSLVQSRPPWRTDERDRSRPRRTRSEERRHRQREAERRNERTNAHRPWRMERVRPGPTSGGGECEGGNGTEASASSPHPATVHTTEGPVNMGVHAWHVLLDMVSAFDAPEVVEYGVTADQRNNIMATFASMPSTDRVRMLSSLLRTMAILCHDVADCVDEVQDAETRRRSSPGEGSSFMQTSLQSHGSEGQRAMTLQTEAIAGALDLMPVHKARKRASALLGRLYHAYARDFENRMQLHIYLQQLEATLVVHLADGAHLLGEDVVEQDKEWVDYWWSIVARHLPRPIPPGDEGPTSAMLSGVGRWSRFLQGSEGETSAPAGSMMDAGRPRGTKRGAEVVEEERLHPSGESLRAGSEQAGKKADNDLALTAEEMEMLLSMDKDDGRLAECHEVMDSQEALEAEIAKIDEVHRRQANDRATREREAEQYRRWEQTVLSEAMRPTEWCPPREAMRVTMRGGVARRQAAGTSSGSGASTQTMSWTVQPGDEVHFSVTLESRHGAVHAEVGDDRVEERTVSTQTPHEG